MKKTKLTLLCILLVLAITCASIFLVSCNNDEDDPGESGDVPSGDIFDPSKLEAIITADAIQQFVYDGNVHNVQATLNHDEATLSYSPSQGYTDVGEYSITITAPSTEHYNSVSARVTLIISSETPQTRWDSLLTDLKSAYSIDGDDIKVNIKADATVTPKQGSASKIKLEALGNLDLRKGANNKTNLHMLFELDDNQYGLYFQQESTFLKLNDDIFSLNSVDIASLIPSNGENSKPIIDTSIIDTIAIFLPQVLFSDTNEIEKIDGVWNLSIDLDKSWSKIKPLLSLFAGDILSEENMAVLDEFFNENKPAFAFKIDCNTLNALKVEANISAAFGAFKANVSAMEIANGAFDTVEGALTPAQIAQAKAVNLANATIEGTLGLVNTLGETYEHLNWKLVVDIDPFALIEAINSSDGINWLNNEKVKNMKVYFSLFHKHQTGEGVECTDVMCPTRAGGMEDTTLLDIAFDPQNFGDSKLYIAANLSRILSEKSLSATLQNLNGLINSAAGTMLAGLVNQNFMTAIDLTKTIGASEEEEPGEPDQGISVDITKIINPIFELLTNGIKLQNNAITLDMEQTYSLLDSILDLNSLININLADLIKINATNVKDAIFKGLLSPDDEGDTDKAFNSLSLGITSIEYGNAETFNCKDAITHDPVDNTKDRKFVGSKPLALNNANATATGKIFNTKQSYNDYTVENGGIHATIEELDNDVVGKLAEYTYTAIDGQTYTAITQIIAYEGLDKTLLNTPQTIKAIVLPLDGQGGLFSDFLWSVIKNLGSISLLDGVLPSNITLPIKADVIDMEIVLTEVTSSQFHINEEFESAYELTPYEYDQTAKIDMSKHLGGTIDLVYADGFTRTIPANCTTDLVEGKFLVNDGKEYTITLTHYSIPEIKKEYKVQAQSPDKPSLVINKNGSISVFNYGLTQNLKLEMVLKTSSSSSGQVIPTSDYKITIGGKSLDEISLDSNGATRFDLAMDSKDVIVNFKKTVAKTSYATAYFSLAYDDGTKSTEIKYPKSFVKVAQEALWGTIDNSTPNLGSNIDGKLTYTYWTESDDDFADARKLSLFFEDGKYYMVDNAENPTVKAEVTLTAYDKNDSTKTNILVNGLIPFEKLQELSFNTTTKSSKIPSINISATFTVDGKEVTKDKTNQGLLGVYLLNYTSSLGKIESEKTFDDLVKFVVVTRNGESHDMRLFYKNGKYVFVDTFDGTKLNDVEVTVLANVAINNSTIGDAITLKDGKLDADQVGKRVTLTVQFTYDEREFSLAVFKYKLVA